MTRKIIDECDHCDHVDVLKEQPNGLDPMMPGHNPGWKYVDHDTKRPMWICPTCREEREGFLRLWKQGYVIQMVNGVMTLVPFDPEKETAK